MQALDAFLAGDDLPAKKPDPSIYVLAAERMGVQPEQCLVIEDSAIGLQVSQYGPSLNLDTPLELFHIEVCPSLWAIACGFSAAQSVCSHCLCDAETLS